MEGRLWEDKVKGDCNVLLERVDALKRLINDPQTGYLSWWVLLGNVLTQIKEVASKSLGES